MRVGSNALELDLNEAIVELGRTDFLLANFDLQALFVESLGKYYSEDVALWLQDKLTEGKLASFRRMADAVEPIHTLLEMGMASIDRVPVDIDLPESARRTRCRLGSSAWRNVFNGAFRSAGGPIVSGRKESL
jgi:hypothetical protein